MNTQTYLAEVFGLTGHSALVTGGSSGLGRAMALALAAAGAQVHVVGRDAARLHATASAAAECAGSITTQVADLSTETGLAATAQRAAEIDILVNSAGVNHRPPLAATTESALQETLDLNLLVPYRLGQAAGPRMAERGFGRIINIGSQQSWSAFGNSGVYGVSKAAIAGLTRSQAEAWSASGVTANTLVPGFVVTPMTEATIAVPGREEALAARTLVGRNGVPADVTSAILFVASPASGFVTGQTIAVDGGFSVH